MSPLYVECIKLKKGCGTASITVYNGEKAIETVDSTPESSLILMDIDLAVSPHKGPIFNTEARETVLITKYFEYRIGFYVIRKAEKNHYCDFKL